jgi:ketosteroid isomerase-like protein
MNLQENTNIVQQAYDNYKNGNLPALLNLVAENVSWELPEMEGVAVAGTRRGRDGVADFFSQLAATQEVVSFEPAEFIAQGNKVVSLGRYTFTVKVSGGQFTSDFAHVFTIENGRITRFQEFTDTLAVANAYRQQAASAA